MMNKKCPSCGLRTGNVRSVIVRQEIKTGCDRCLPQQLQQAHDGNAKFNREYQKKQYRKELTQPNDKAYAKAYPDKFRETHGNELFRRMG